MPPPTSTPSRSRMATSPVPCSPGLGLKETVEEYLAATVKEGGEGEGEDKKEGEEEDEELDLTGIDDDEIDSYLMSPEEIESKTNLWMKINHDFLKEQAEKIKREAEVREEMIKNGIDPDRKKKTYKKRNKAYLQSNGTALEAIEKIVQEKKLSSKINYDVLKNLSFGLGSLKKKEDADEAPATTSDASILLESGPVKRGHSPINVDSTKKRSRLTKKPNPSPPKEDVVPKSDPDQRSLYDTEPVVESGPIIETGPVEPYEEVSQSGCQSGCHFKNLFIQDEISDFSDDEDTPMKSAAELLSQQFGAENGYGQEEEYF